MSIDGRLATLACHSAVRKKEILAHETTWMDLEGVTLSDMSPTEEDKYCGLSLICGTFRSQTGETESKMAGTRGGNWGIRDVEATLLQLVVKKN